VRLLGAAILVASGVLVGAPQQQSNAPFGFMRSGAAAERATETQFLSVPSADRIRDAHRYLADKPHLAGSERDRELAVWTRDRFAEFGLESVEISTHEVLLPWPEEVTVEMTVPRTWRASMREDPIESDPYTQIAPESAGIPYHAYSASGDVTAPVLYAGSGNPADYDRLAANGHDIRGKIALVRYSVPYSYRGFKAFTAQRRGAAGILIYSDPEDDGEGKGKVYPEGPWGPVSHIQRGGIVYDFMVPGDPLTPGWSSVPGARRIERSAAVSLPRIISAPLSYKDARVILEALGNPHRKQKRPRGVPAVVVHMRVRSDDRTRPIWTVTGMIRGVEQPDDFVIVGNHRDAWVYGGVDPSSGSAALVELARAIGELARTGRRPKRSILFASWDAEEFTLTSSTEWGEQHEAWLRDHAVAYLNVDSAASGPNFTATAVPALNRVIAEAAQIVRDPVTRTPVAAVSRARSARERGALPRGSGDELIDNRLGSGSDYTVFLNFLGIPVADLAFDGPYGVYHSIYDTHQWVATIGDPGFRYHVALVQLWGIITLRLANADALPLEYQIYAKQIREFAGEVRRRWVAGRGRPGNGSNARQFDEIVQAIAELESAAAALDQRRDEAVARSDMSALASINRRVMAAERAFLDPDGIPGRPWYRHLVFAPKFTYRPEVLPGIAEAVDEGDTARLTDQAQRLTAALRRAAGLLRQ
jgi:N-acetylated-alpha-linked acidic dipeptidase